MSYCVNCGVELAETEKNCPLCDTEVINPRSPWQEPTDSPYPTAYEVAVPLNKSKVATFISILLLIPILVTLLSNLIANGEISWSLYVIGALALAFVVLLFPLYFKKFYTASFIFIDYVALFGYLALIQYLAGGKWVMSIGLPLCIASCGFTWLFFALFRHKKSTTILVRLAIMLISLGVYVMAIELTLLEHYGNPFELQWSYYALIPCAALAMALLFLDSRKDVKEALHKRMFLK